METRKGCWSVAQAKARFSELIDVAVAHGPQTVTRRGRGVAVVIAAKDWKQRSKRKGSLVEFFSASPLRRAGLKLRRRQSRSDPIAL
ncbi:MAG: type II toxin-antitoxin system Phd/YefM family antitoxin [Alphaproteobacteria bacterium]|nr:type II toxin-antitoxin system Phd/YefM family antitoxin [Alphaproteobacteria bacterium]